MNENLSQGAAKRFGTSNFYQWLFLRKEQKSFPHWRGKLTSKITMRKIPDLKSTMREWYNIKNRKIIFLFFCYFGTFLYYEEKSLPIFLLFRNISLLCWKIIPIFFANLDAEWICTYWISTLYVWQAYVHVKIILVCPVLVF